MSKSQKIFSIPVTVSVPSVEIYDSIYDPTVSLSANFKNLVQRTLQELEGSRRTKEVLYHLEAKLFQVLRHLHNCTGHSFLAEVVPNVQRLEDLRRVDQEIAHYEDLAHKSAGYDNGCFLQEKLEDLRFSKKISAEYQSKWLKDEIPLVVSFYISQQLYSFEAFLQMLDQKEGIPSPICPIVADRYKEKDTTDSSPTLTQLEQYADFMWQEADRLNKLK